MPGEVPHAGQAKGTLYVQALEGPNVNPSGGDAPSSTMIKLLHAHTQCKDNMSSKDRQVQPGNLDKAMEMGCGSGAEVG